MKHKYQVLAGLHIEDKVTYKKGEIVESASNLCKLFPQKFKDLGPVSEKEETTKSETKPDTKAKTEEVLPPTKPAKKKTAAKSSKGEDEWDD